MKPDVSEIDTNLARAVLAHVHAMDGVTGSVTLHINQGRVTRIERVMSTPFTASIGLVVTP
jgi:hypothetical protein